MSNTTLAPAGWYPDTTAPGFERYWDGERWTGVQRPKPITVAIPQSVPASSVGPMTHASLSVERRVNYVRQQKGHSLVVHFLLLGLFTLWIVPIYYLVSPNHYYHL